MAKEISELGLLCDNKRKPFKLDASNNEIMVTNADNIANKASAKYESLAREFAKATRASQEGLQVKREKHRIGRKNISQVPFQRDVDNECSWSNG
jgi:hypothetical protein